jgi:CheY-like chemotaxis protein
VTIGRELRDPLTTIQICVEILRRGDPDPTRTERAWDLMERQVGHFSRLVEDLLAGGEETGALRHSSDPPAALPVSAHGLRLLVIEDNPDAAESLRMLLQAMGCVVETAPEGTTGLAKALTFQPQLVLCDIGLPGALDGYGVARAFRTDARLRATPLVALTGLSRAEDRERSMEAGFELHLVKPVSSTGLREALSFAATDGAQRAS